MDAMTLAEAASLAARQGRLTAEERARLDAAIAAGAPPYTALHWNEARLAACAPFYYADADTLHLLEEPAQPHFILDAGEYALLRVHADTFEILGASIEDFEERFLPRYPEFKQGWGQTIKPHLTNDRQASAEEIARYNLALMHRILDWLRESERAGRKRTKTKA